MKKRLLGFLLAVGLVSMLGACSDGDADLMDYDSDGDVDVSDYDTMNDINDDSDY